MLDVTDLSLQLAQIPEGPHPRTRHGGVPAKDRPGPAPLPVVPGVRVRAGTLADLAFIDALQRKHTKAVGWMPTGQLEGHVARGHVLVAEAIGRQPLAISEGSTEDPKLTAKGYGLTASPAAPQPIGYCIGVDKYFKREDVGIIYQMNVEPGRQRGLIGATLLKAMFDSWPYGVRLCCCWCAQDLAANWFWEAMGFVALAFRAGSAKRSRVHIFWQKRIRAGDDQMPYWFPSQTGAGALKEDRIVLPIPPGSHWRDAKPMVVPGVLPGLPGLPGVGAGIGDQGSRELPGAEVRGQISEVREQRSAERRRTRKAKPEKKEEPVRKEAVIGAGGLRFGVGGGDAKPQACKSDRAGDVRKGRPRLKNDPRYVAAARELRDRWLERVNADGASLQLTGGASGGKYDVSKAIEGGSGASGASGGGGGGGGGDVQMVDGTLGQVAGGDAVRILPAA